MRPCGLVGSEARSPRRSRTARLFFYLDAPIRRVAGYDIPIPYNPNLERNAVPTPERIEKAIRELLA